MRKRDVDKIATDFVEILLDIHADEYADAAVSIRDVVSRYNLSRKNVHALCQLSYMLKHKVR